MRYDHPRFWLLAANVGMEQELLRYAWLAEAEEEEEETEEEKKKKKAEEEEETEEEEKEAEVI